MPPNPTWRHASNTAIATGGYILHSGLEKWHGDETRAKALHGVASNAFPVLQRIPPERSRALFDAWAGPKTWLAVPRAASRRPDNAARAFDSALTTDAAKVSSVQRCASPFPRRTSTRR